MVTFSQIKTGLALARTAVNVAAKAPVALAAVDTFVAAEAAELSLGAIVGGAALGIGIGVGTVLVANKIFEEMTGETLWEQIVPSEERKSTKITLEELIREAQRWQWLYEFNGKESPGFDFLLQNLARHYGVNLQTLAHNVGVNDPYAVYNMSPPAGSGALAVTAPAAEEMPSEEDQEKEKVEREADAKIIELYPGVRRPSRFRWDEIRRLVPEVLKSSDDDFELMKNGVLPKNDNAQKVVDYAGPFLYIFSRWFINVWRARGVSLDLRETALQMRPLFLAFLKDRKWNPEGGMHPISWAKSRFAFATYASRAFARSNDVMLAYLRAEQRVYGRARRAGEHYSRTGYLIRLRTELALVHLRRARDPQAFKDQAAEEVPSILDLLGDFGEDPEQYERLVNAIANSINDFLRDPQIPQFEKEVFLLRHNVDRVTHRDVATVFGLTRQAISGNEKRALAHWETSLRRRFQTIGLDEEVFGSPEDLLDTLRDYRSLLPSEQLSRVMVAAQFDWERWQNLLACASEITPAMPTNYQPLREIPAQSVLDKIRFDADLSKFTLSDLEILSRGDEHFALEGRWENTGRIAVPTVLSAEEAGRQLPDRFSVGLARHVSPQGRISFSVDLPAGRGGEAVAGSIKQSGAVGRSAESILADITTEEDFARLSLQDWQTLSGNRDRFVIEGRFFEAHWLGALSVLSLEEADHYTDTNQFGLFVERREATPGNVSFRISSAEGKQITKVIKAVEQGGVVTSSPLMVLSRITNEEDLSRLSASDWEVLSEGRARFVLTGRRVSSGEIYSPSTMNVEDALNELASTRPIQFYIFIEREVSKDGAVHFVIREPFKGYYAASVVDAVEEGHVVQIEASARAGYRSTREIGTGIKTRSDLQTISTEKILQESAGASDFYLVGILRDPKIIGFKVTQQKPAKRDSFYIQVKKVEVADLPLRLELGAAMGGMGAQVIRQDLLASKSVIDPVQVVLDRVSVDKDLSLLTRSDWETLSQGREVFALEGEMRARLNNIYAPQVVAVDKARKNFPTRFSIPIEKEVVDGNSHFSIPPGFGGNYAQTVVNAIEAGGVVAVAEGARENRINRAEVGSGIKTRDSVRTLTVPKIASISGGVDHFYFVGILDGEGVIGLKVAQEKPKSDHDFYAEIKKSGSEASTSYAAGTTNGGPRVADFLADLKTSGSVAVDQSLIDAARANAASRRPKDNRFKNQASLRSMTHAELDVMRNGMHRFAIRFRDYSHDGRNYDLVGFEVAPAAEAAAKKGGSWLIVDEVPGAATPFAIEQVSDKRTRTQNTVNNLVASGLFSFQGDK